MVVCKFFLQGNCRYGEMCKFEHQTGGNRNSNSSILRQQNFAANPNTYVTGTNVDTNTLLQSVANDMISAEKGGQWMLSCYTPFKEKSPFPGFEDQSFEEVRWGFYEAQLNGTVSQYCQQLQTLLQNTAIQMKLLQNPTPDIINTITSIYYSAPLSSTSSANTNSVFGGFSNQNTAATSIFAAANQKLFGPQPVQTNSVFANSQNIFRNANQNSFVQQQQFQLQQQPQQQPFQQPQNFSNSPLQQNNTTLLNSNNQFNSFVSQTNPPPLVQLSTSSQSSIFGSHDNTVVSFTQKPSVQDESAYSKPEDLSEQDLTQFNGDSFEFGKIPEKPPTSEMCF